MSSIQGRSQLFGGDKKNKTRGRKHMSIFPCCRNSVSSSTGHNWLVWWRWKQNKLPALVISVTRHQSIWTRLAVFLSVFLFTINKAKKKIMKFLPNLFFSSPHPFSFTHTLSHICTGEFGSFHKQKPNVSHTPSNYPWLRHWTLTSSCSLIREECWLYCWKQNTK